MNAIPSGWSIKKVRTGWKVTAPNGENATFFDSESTHENRIACDFIAALSAPAGCVVVPAAWAAVGEDGKVEALGFNQSRTRFTTPLYLAAAPAVSGAGDSAGLLACAGCGEPDGEPHTFDCPQADPTPPVAGSGGVERLADRLEHDAVPTDGDCILAATMLRNHARIVAELRAHTAEVVADAIRLREIRHKQWATLQAANQRAETMAGLLGEAREYADAEDDGLTDRIDAILPTPEGA